MINYSELLERLNLKINSINSRNKPTLIYLLNFQTN